MLRDNIWVVELVKLFKDFDELNGFLHEFLDIYMALRDTDVEEINTDEDVQRLIKSVEKFRKSSFLGKYKSTHKTLSSEYQEKIQKIMDD